MRTDAETPDDLEPASSEVDRPEPADDTAIEDAVTDSATNDPAIDDSAIDDPATDDPATDDPAIDDPATNDPSAGTDDTATDDPATNDPSAGTDDPAGTGIDIDALESAFGLVDEALAKLDDGDLDAAGAIVASLTDHDAVIDLTEAGHGAAPDPTSSAPTIT